MNSKSYGDFLSIIIPCYNEASNILKFYDEILKQIFSIKNLNPNLKYELIFVNDGSKDDTLGILKELCNKDLNVHLIDFSRNFGKEAAILAGLRQSKGDCVVLVDADLQDPVELIYTMYENFFFNKADIIYARRINRNGEGKIRAFLSEIFYKTMFFISEVKIHSGVRDFRLMSRKVVNAILECNEYHRFSKTIFEWVGFDKICLEYKYIPRKQGHSTWSFWKLFKYAIEGMISFSTLPLRLAFIVGFLASLSSFLYAIFIIIDTLIFGNDVKGYPSLICAIIFFGGVQLIFLGIIGEYIARIYEQVKNRPHFIIKQKR